MRETDQYSQLGRAERPKVESVKKSTPMNMAFDEITGLQGRTDDLLEVLQNLLAPALGPAYPRPEACEPEAYPESTCELHEQAMFAVRRQRRINDQLQELTERVAI